MKPLLLVVRSRAVVLALLVVLTLSERSAAAADGYPYPALGAFLREQLQAEKQQRLDLCAFAPGLQDYVDHDEPPRTTPLAQEIGCLEDLLVNQIHFLVYREIAIRRQRLMQEELDATARTAQWLATSAMAEPARRASGCGSVENSLVLCLYRSLLLRQIDWSYEWRSRKLDGEVNIVSGYWLLRALIAATLPPAPLDGPPFNDVFEGLDRWGDGSYLRSEQQEILDLCAATPERLTGGAPDLVPFDEVTPHDWHTMRCLELWLVHQFVMIKGPYGVEQGEPVVEEFRAKWRGYWLNYYGPTYPEQRAVPVPPPTEQWLPSYLRLLKELIDNAYTSRLGFAGLW